MVYIENQIQSFARSCDSEGPMSDCQYVLPGLDNPQQDIRVRWWPERTALDIQIGADGPCTKLVHMFYTIRDGYVVALQPPRDSAPGLRPDIECSIPVELSTFSAYAYEGNTIHVFQYRVKKYTTLLAELTDTYSFTLSGAPPGELDRTKFSKAYPPYVDLATTLVAWLSGTYQGKNITQEMIKNREFLLAPAFPLNLSAISPPNLQQHPDEAKEVYN